MPPTDPTLLNEMVTWYKAVGGFLLGLVVALLARIWTKHEDKEETQEVDHKRRYDDHLRKVTELEIRIVRIEARETLTRTDLYEIVKEVLEEVTKRFQKDHGELSLKVERCADTITARVDALAMAVAKKEH